jgi:hypothetical protein
MEIGKDRQAWAGEDFLMRKGEGGCAGMKRGCRVEKDGEAEGSKRNWPKGEVLGGRAGELKKRGGMRGVES